MNKAQGKFKFSFKMKKIFQKMKKLCFSTEQDWVKRKNTKVMKIVFLVEIIKKNKLKIEI